MCFPMNFANFLHLLPNASVRLLLSVKNMWVENEDIISNINQILSQNNESCANEIHFQITN